MRNRGASGTAPILTTKTGSVLVVAALAMVALPIVPAAGASDGEDVCIAAQERAQAALEAYLQEYPDGVPAALAEPPVKDVYVSCYVEAPSSALTTAATCVGGGIVCIPDASIGVGGESLLEGLGAGDPGIVDVCSGGGSTITGWSTDVEIAGQRPIPILNGPASSHLDWFEQTDNQGRKTDLVEGYARSTPDDIVFYLEASDVVPLQDQRAAWDFLGIPMAGFISVESNCVLGLVTSSDFSASGFPVVNVNEILDENVLLVNSGGTTCVVPC